MRTCCLLVLLAGCAQAPLHPTDREAPDPQLVVDGGAPPADELAPPDEGEAVMETASAAALELDAPEVQPDEPTCTTGTAHDGPVRQIIRDVFGRHGDAAIRVSWCESGPWGTSARNGQYKGLFQMGRYERATYGHGPCAEQQIRAAHRYFVAAHGWGPWECRP